MEEIKRIKAEAVFTVEAALILPIVIGGLVIVIFMSFYLHDYVVLKAAAAETAAGGFQEEDTAFREQLFYFRNISQKAEMQNVSLLEGGGVRYQISYQAGENPAPWAWISSLTGAGGNADRWEGCEGKGTYIAAAPEELIWMFQLVQNGTEGGGKENGDQIPMGEKQPLYAD